MADITWWQTLLSGASGGALTLVGQIVVKRRETQAQREARALDRREAVYDRRLSYELERLEELRRALVEADDVAPDGRRRRRQDLENSPAAALMVSEPASVRTVLEGRLPIDHDRADRYGPAMVALRSSIAVTLDDGVRAAAQDAFAYLDTGRSAIERPVGRALDAVGDRLRAIQGKVDPQ